jgi:O-succinylbenzoic acid--CoA ligase
MNMSWESPASLVLINPSYAPTEQARFQRILEATRELPGHVWLSTSGSSSPKWVGLSKQAILASAEAVNCHLESTADDVWVQPLPNFHVGGLGIWARAYLSGAGVHDFRCAYPGKWQAEIFYHYIQQTKGTLTSLVPAQLHDLVALGWQAPPSLRAVIIGGGALLPLLYEQAVALGWPLLPSYGMTECASQIATAPLSCCRQSTFPPLHLLSHLQGGEQEGRLCFAGASVLSAYAYLEGEDVHVSDPKVKGWFLSEDRGRIQEKDVHFLGRADAMVKVGGENVDMARLETLLQTLHLRLGGEGEVALVAMPDFRLGHRIDLAVTQVNPEKVKELVAHFHQHVLPFERIRHAHRLSHFPRSALGKILRQKLLNLITINYN